MQDTLQLFAARNGLLSAKVSLPDSTFRHIHSLVDPSVEGAFFENLDFWGDVIVFAGLGLGYHIVPCVLHLPREAIVIAIDYYDALIDHCRKNVFPGLANRVIYLSAVNADEAAASAAASMRQKPSAAIQVIKHPASFDIHKPYYETVLDRLFPISTTAVKARPSITRHATVKSALLMYGNFFLEHEIASALRANKVEPGLFLYNKHPSPLQYENAMMRQLQEERPSIIFSVNMKGIDGNGIFEDVARRLGIPVVVWFVDDPRRIMTRQFSLLGTPPFPPLSADRVPCLSPAERGELGMSAESGGKGGVPNDTIAACWEKSYLPWLEQAGFPKVAYLPLATDPAIFQAATPASPSIQLGFVGTSMVDEYAGKIREKFLWADSLDPLVEKASENLLSNPDYDIDKNLAECAQSLSMKLPFSDAKNISWLCAYIIHTASMKKRKRIIGALMSEGIETFGDEAGWKYLLGPSVKTHPDVDYRHGLRDIYRSIRINVNVTSCQMPLAVNQRVFDIPCSGSFVISDAQKDLYDLFDVGKEAIVYENLDDLKDKIRFYTTHEEERKKIIDAAQKRILGEHTYAKRISSLLRLI